MARDKKYFLSILLVVLAFCLKAQSPDYSQTFTNLVYTNPAFAGTRVCPRLYANYRNKYVSLGSAYVTYLATYDQYLNPVRGDIAIIAFRDVLAKGVFQTNYFNVVYARGVSLNNKLRLKLGIEAGYISSQMTNANQSYSDMIDPVYGYVFQTGEQALSISQRGLDLSAGLLLFSSNYYLGFSSHHLNRSPYIEPNTGSLVCRTFSLHGGINLMIGNQLSNDKYHLLLAPNFNFQFQQQFAQLLLGTYVQRHKLLTGIWIKQTFKNSESFIFLIGYVQKKYKFAYNCDMYFWSKKMSLPDVHEVSVTYYFGCNEHKKKPRAMQCPGL